MGKYCKFTGADTTAEGYECPIKKMCLNCECVIFEEDSEGNRTYYCTNESVMEAGKKKILAAVPEGYEIETLTLKPMLLKNPTKKCANHTTDYGVLENELKRILG